ncbi:peptidylprolyl isomerase [Cohnella zeiphila]|uniref:Peptidylprolyl isomerase n=1 Tax=Cohnella zeiphila TaxID=2761120 RepID=A0A7X0VXA2_9BACL|nr:peptidylprolyl isomerase [Cohnella zeiphila]MBB6733375.1 peptidylprolyl isomerase [Cohnella zeiphila]
MLHPERGRWRRAGLALLAAVLLAALAAGCGKKENKLAAEYDGGQITTKEFTAYKTFLKLANPSYASFVDEDSVQETILQQFIGTRILSERATDDAKKKGEDSANQTFKSFQDSLAATDAETKQSIDDLMKSGGLTDDLMKTYLKEQFVAQDDAEAKVTDADIQSYYDKNKDSFKYVTVRHILIGLTDKDGKTREKADALKLANEVKQKLDDGGDWTALAKQYSDDTGSSENGGLYEKADPSQWVEEFKNAAETLPLNQISDPVESTYGYHVMKVEARGTKTLDESKTSIRTLLGSQTIDKFMSDELPKLITKTYVPKPSPSPSASASASPSASAGASASASPSGSASAPPSASAPASPSESPVASK